jgi:hypothetical protein
MYSQTASRAKPACVLFLIDQSFSMDDGIAGTKKSISSTVATAVNKLIFELIQICEKGDDKPRHWFDVGMIGYTSDANGTPIVGSAFGGALAGRNLVSIPDLNDNPLDFEVRKKKVEQVDDTGNLVLVDEEVKFMVWYQMPQKELRFATPMRTAFEYARPIVEQWIAEHPDSFPPLLIHLTDGESTDGDPKEAAAAVQSLATSDGNVLILNCHISSNKAEGVLFPTSADQLPDVFAKDLYEMSSGMPDSLRATAEAKQVTAPLGCRLMAFNADAVTLVKLLSVGTISTPAPGDRPAHLR